MRTFILLFEDGKHLIIQAHDFDWDSANDEIAFLDKDDDPIAIFKLGYVIGVSLAQENVDDNGYVKMIECKEGNNND